MRNFFGIRFVALLIFTFLAVGLWIHGPSFKPKPVFATPFPQPPILPHPPAQTPLPEEIQIPTPTSVPTPTPTPTPTPLPTPTPVPEPPPEARIEIYRSPGAGKTAIFAEPPMQPILDWFEPPLEYVYTLPTATRFDFPIGSPNGAMAYNAQPFGKRGHLGDDWNGLGGYDTDLGDPVHAVATGRVVFAAWIGGDWGNVVIVQHAIQTEVGREYIQSLYAHLLQVDVSAGQLVCRGDVIGLIGNADGKFFAHLHLEMRTTSNLFVGGGYLGRKSGWLAPQPFISSHRGAAADDFSPELFQRPGN